jgi:hypothetical protein
MPPCDATSTLQQCVDGANSGDTVEIATNGPIAEAISFAKSLTLQAAQGFTPVFSAGQSISAASSSTGSSFIAIEGLTLTNGTISVTQNSASPLNVQVLRNTIELGDPHAPAISVLAPAGTLGTIMFDVSANTVAVPSGSIPTPSGILVSFTSSTIANANGRIANNSIVMQGSSGYGIYVNIILSPGGNPSSLDLIANHVSGTGYPDGILLDAGVSGPTSLRVLDNLVTGQGGESGAPGAIVVDAFGGMLTAFVVNNTVAGNDEGIVMGTLAGGMLSGLAANNIVTGNSQVGFEIDSSSVTNRNNLVFGNHTDSFTAGPGTVTADPVFVGSGDFHLRTGSPAIDAGDDGSLPADLTTDLDGNPRIQGAHVDIGAYETAPEPDAQMLAVTALAALLGVVAREASVPGNPN